VTINTDTVGMERYELSYSVVIFEDILERAVAVNLRADVYISPLYQYIGYIVFGTFQRKFVTT
jgi:hypothetical protein